jgi:hypothetical protein
MLVTILTCSIIQISLAASQYEVAGISENSSADGNFSWFFAGCGLD